MINFRMLKVSDYTLFICVGLLLLIGTMMILSTTFSMQTRAGEDPFMYFKRHLFLVFLGLVAMFAMMYMDVSNLRSAAVPLYVAVILILMLVIVKGYTLQ
jgi:cell division protein FtsW